MGERGRLLEGAISDLLRELLPKKYSIGTGIIVNNAGAQSSQIDIVIYDEQMNIHLNLGDSKIFPIECVYGTVEVKATLTRNEVRSVCASIARMRRMANKKAFVDYQAKPAGPKGKFVSSPKKKSSPLPPRSFVIAFSATSKNVTTIKRWLTDNLNDEDSMIHALYVFTPNFFASQKPYQDQRVFDCSASNNAFYRFITDMFDTLLSMKLGTLHLNSYFKIPGTSEMQ